MLRCESFTRRLVAQVELATLVTFLLVNMPGCNKNGHLRSAQSALTSVNVKCGQDTKA